MPLNIGIQIYASTKECHCGISSRHPSVKMEITKRELVTRRGGEVGGGGGHQEGMEGGSQSPGGESHYTGWISRSDTMTVFISFIKRRPLRSPFLNFRTWKCRYISLVGDSWLVGMCILYWRKIYSEADLEDIHNGGTDASPFQISINYYNGPTSDLQF